MELGADLDGAAEALQNAIFRSLHASDLFTRYSPSQFLILVEDITRPNCEMVAKRISQCFEELCDVKGVQLVTSIVPGYEKTEDENSSALDLD